MSTRPVNPAKPIVDALLQRFLPLAGRRIDTAQAQDGQYLRASEPAYEQVLDSLAMAAHYTPMPLLEALCKWRESDTPKGANDASTFQRKLAVECIFCSACIRFVECCPPEGLVEHSWRELENFIFDWLINADKVVSQTDYPSLVDLRSLLLDLVARLLGALSRIRFGSVTERFFNELNSRRNDTNVARSETLSIISGMRYLKLGVNTVGGLNASTSFVAKANPLTRTPAKKKSELHHALCNMLFSILAPVADAGKGQWPPSGVDAALSLWYDAVFRFRSQLMHWMEKQSKHIIVGYPLVTLLLCLGDPQNFNNNFGTHMEHLYKLLRERSLRSMALDCLHRVVRFYLNVYADIQPKNRVWDHLYSVTSQLLALLKKGSLTLDAQHDKVVEFCLTIAESNLDFAMNHMVLELLRNDNPSEAKVIGLRALLAMVSSPKHHRSSSDTLKLEDAHATGNPSSFSPWSYTGSGVSVPSRSPFTNASSAPASTDSSHDISQYIPKVRAALDQIIRTCHSTYGAARLTSPKAMLDSMTKEKQQGWMVFIWALKCVPNLIPEIWRNDRMTEILPAYGISREPGVREEAVQVLFRTVRALPYSRPAVMKGMANFILQLPDDYPLLIHTSLVRLVQLLHAWRNCLAEESLFVEKRNTKSAKGSGELNFRSTPFRSNATSNKFSPHGMDAIGLIFLCSVDFQTRLTALELLRCVRALQSDIKYYSKRKSDFEELQPTFVIDVFEEAGEDIVQKSYWDPGRWFDLRSEWDVVPADITLQSILEGHDKGRWGRCLSELVKFTAVLCPDAVDAARLEVVVRLANMTPLEFGGKTAQVQDFDSKLEQWHLYSMFACSCPPEDSEDGGLQAAKDMFSMIFPLLRSVSDGQIYAASLALGHAHVDLFEVMLASLLSFLEELTTESENRPKWKSQKVRREDIRVHVANVYRMVADSIWPGMLSRKSMLQIHFARFIDETVRHICSSPQDLFQELQPLRYSLASVIRALSPELVKVSSERLDARSRRRLFDLLASWCDDSMSSWGQDSVSDYRREIERYKSAQSIRTKDSMEKINLDKEINEQVEAVQWMAMNAMAALLFGPCFDDGARKITGRVFSWINGLFLDNTPRVPIGYSPADPRTPSHSKFGIPVPSIGNRDKQRGSHFRTQLAKTALMNILQSNLELFPACIDKCYAPDLAIADGYFSVVAEVYMRQEIPKCEIQRLLSLILYKVVDPDRQIRDDALQMLETLSAREWADEGEGAGRYRAAVVGNLPDSYQQFQYQLSAKLAKEHPELSEYLCEEIMQRQLDAVDIIAQHQVLTCMAPWIENLQLWILKCTGWCERLLKSIYYVTWRHGDHFPDEIEKLWSTVARKVRNVDPVLDFLISKGIEDCDSNASGEISGAFATYFPVAKRISLYLARVSPQRTIDHLVFALAQRMSDDQPEQVRRATELAFELDGSHPVLEFSQGPQQVQMLDPLPPMSPLLIRSSLEGQLRNVSGNLSWRTATGRSMSGPLNAMPDIQIHTGRSGQLFTGSGPLSISGPLMGVRTSTGSLKSRHLSRDSGDCYIETSTTLMEEICSTTPAVVGDFQSGLQGHHHWLSKADIALILLAEIAYENDEDFRGYLPLLFHVTFVSMDSAEDIVLEHCQQLLVNLLYSLAGRPLESYSIGEFGNGEDKKQVESLMKYVQSKKGTMMWEHEDMTLTRVDLPSAALLSALVQSVVDAVFFQGDLRQRWGEEALKWAIECSSRHLACRSHQIFRALRPSVTTDTCVSLLRCLHRCFSNPSPPVLGFIMEILLSLQVIVEIMEPEKVILYPQLFWGCVAMLHTDYVHIYTQVLELFARVIDHLSFQDRTIENVLLSNMPKDDYERTYQHEAGGQEDEAGPDKVKPPLFEGVQPLVLKGLMSPLSHGSAIEVLSRITLDSCDCILGSSETRLLMHIVGVLPWLCLQLQHEQTSTAYGFEPSLPHQYQRACLVAGNIAEWCEAKGLDDMAIVFSSYSAGQTTVDGFLDRLSPLLCAEWFPRHSALAFGHLLRLLEKVLPEYQRVILVLLRALLQYTSIEPSQSPQVYGIVSQLVEGPLCHEALKVLEALLQNCSTLSSSGLADGTFIADPNSGIAANRRMDEDRQDKPTAVLVSQSSFKARSGPLLYSGGPGVVQTSSIDALPSKETALQNTKLALGRVLETYGSGKRKDYKRLVPFVASNNSSHINNSSNSNRC